MERRRGPAEQVRGGHRGRRGSRRPGGTRFSSSRSCPARPGAEGALCSRLGHCPPAGRAGPRCCRAPVPAERRPRPPDPCPWGRGSARVGGGVTRMRSALCPAHPTPPQRRSAPLGAGGGRSRRGSRSGRWLPPDRLGKVDPRRAGARPAAPRGWAAAGAESEPPEIPVPLIPRWPGQSSGLSAALPPPRCPSLSATLRCQGAPGTGTARLCQRWARHRLPEPLRCPENRGSWAASARGALDSSHAAPV